MKKLFLHLLLLCVVTIGYGQNLKKIVASDRATDDRFGYPVSISGNFAIVGAKNEDEDASGMNTMTDAGAAYIFERDTGENWVEVQKIVASDRAVGDWFGYTVSISGNYAIVGADKEDEDASGINTMIDAGAAYVFERDTGGSWVEVQKIVASDRAADDRFGYPVSISGNYAIVGAFKEDEDATGINTMVDAGAAYVFERDTGGSWVEVQKIVASDRATDDRFGLSASVSGNFAIVGAYKEDEDESGMSTKLDAGSAYIFERDTSGSWIEVQKIVASDRTGNDWFGSQASISGNFAIVGAWNEDEDAFGLNYMDFAGSAYIFERDTGGTWNQMQKIVASDRGIADRFGSPVSISGSYAIVGARTEDEDESGINTMVDAGSAYVFELDNDGTWTEIQKIIAPDRAAGDQFGSVSISGNYAIIGAYKEDEDAIGGNTMLGAGSAYVFKLSCIIDTSLKQNNVTLSANQTGATYQWLDCDNNFAIISGATNQIYTAAANGNYAVIITINDCTDTSFCYSVKNVGIIENDFDIQISVYPNPNSGNFVIEMDIEKTQDLEISLLNVIGQKVYVESLMKFSGTYQKIIDIGNHGKGIYYMQLKGSEGIIIWKITVQ